MSNLHVTLDEANKHTPKGFDPAVNNTQPAKDEQGLSTYEERMKLPKAINFVDGTVAPPTTNDLDVFVLIGSGTEDAGWGAAVFGDWVRFTNSIANPITPSDGYLCFDETTGDWMKYDGSVWAVFGGAVAAPSGPFALFDTAGVPTYYTTLALVIAAASSGDVIQQFADVTTTAAVSALPSNVHWNLNGFTYEKTGGSSAISIGDNRTHRITNGRIFANGSGGNCIDAPANNTYIYCDGLVLQSTAEVIRGKVHGFVGVHFYNATIESNSTTLAALNSGSYYNCIVRSTGTAPSTSVCSDLIQCEISNTGANAVSVLKGTAIDCHLISTGAVTCAGATFRAKNCIIESTASNAIDAVLVEVEDCNVGSTAGTGITSSNGFAIGCTINGVSVDYGFRTVFGTQKVERCTITNSAGPGIDRGANSELINCVVRSTFNSAAGFAIRVNTGIVAGSAPVIANCSVSVANTGTNYLFSTGATVANFANVVSIDKLVVVTPVTANITQGNVASDSEGNNF